MRHDCSSGCSWVFLWVLLWKHGRSVDVVFLGVCSGCEYWVLLDWESLIEFLLDCSSGCFFGVLLMCCCRSEGSFARGSGGDALCSR